MYLKVRYDDQGRLFVITFLFRVAIMRRAIKTENVSIQTRRDSVFKRMRNALNPTTAIRSGWFFACTHEA